MKAIELYRYQRTTALAQPCGGAGMLKTTMTEHRSTPQTSARR
ncbi:hypothetical protein [Thermosporothrix hazakensis]|nr:hypothetical protein [Thermosporothrix hazakensis]